MTTHLTRLIDAARQLAGQDGTFHSGRIWQFEGGRACPIGWVDCSQAVYVDLTTGEHDYGEPGGVGDADCRANCKHGLQPPSEDDL